MLIATMDELDRLKDFLDEEKDEDGKIDVEYLKRYIEFKKGTRWAY